MVTAGNRIKDIVSPVLTDTQTHPGASWCVFSCHKVQCAIPGLVPCPISNLIKSLCAPETEAQIASPLPSPLTFLGTVPQLGSSSWLPVPAPYCVGSYGVLVIWEIVSAPSWIGISPTLVFLLHLCISCHGISIPLYLLHSCKYISICSIRGIWTFFPPEAIKNKIAGLKASPEKWVKWMWPSGIFSWTETNVRPNHL